MNDQEASNIYLVLSDDNLTGAQVEELNQLTKEIGQSLEKNIDAIESISYVSREALPKGTKVAEFVFAQQAILSIIPIVAPWVLTKVDAIIKSFANRGKRVNAKVQVGSHAFQITPQTTKSELAKFQKHVVAANKLSSNNRYALVIGNSDYRDERLADLKSSIVDVERFAEILANPEIGGFTHVNILKNAKNDVIEQNIERFYLDKEPEDLLLLYFSGHGIRSQSGQLYLAAQNTKYDLLRSTGISSNFIKESMDESYSRRQILILDCCYGGAIVEGAKGDNIIGQAAESISAFRSSGFGRVIISASDSMQYAFDGHNIEGYIENSAFTNYLIEGLRSGEADADNDGLITVDELYQYGYRNVIPKQTPSISTTAQEGQLFIGINPNPSIKPAQLPGQLIRAMESENRYSRQGAVSELERLLNDADLSLALAAEIALKKMTMDDSRIVGKSAQEALNRQLSSEPSLQQQPVKSTVEPSPKSTIPSAVQADVALPPHQPSKQVAYKPKKQNLGGVLNVIFPGLGHAYVGNWTRAVITFIIVSVLLSALFFIIFLDLGFCSIPSAIALFIFLFFDGKKAVRMSNEKFETSGEMG